MKDIKIGAPEDNQVQESEAKVSGRSWFEPAGRFIWDLSKVLILSLVIIIPIRYFFFQPFVVSGSSMEPNFSNGDYLIIDEITYRLSEPKRGEVVVMRFPGDTSQFFIKRIIGLPGEKITIEDGTVQVRTSDDTFVLQEIYLARGTRTTGNTELTLDEDEYFVLGDNRSASSDSRSWGPLLRDNIIGRAWLRLLPLDELSLIPQPAYGIR